jgi:5,10-methenyltetrahydromethanopterin hydrogenase cofactor biosynthesis protein HmdC
MYDLIRESVNNMDSALELARSKKNVIEIVDAINDLSLSDVIKLGTNFKQFPLGCDLTEVVVGTCASDLEKIDLLGNCILANMIGAPIHICAYAFSDIANKYGMRGVEIMEEVYNLTDVPLDLDHFGKHGAMKFPKEIVKCWGECYNKGPSFTECPRGRIHKRLIDKEVQEEEDKENWIKLSSSVAVNLTSEQGGEGHSAPFEEAEDIAKIAKKYGKGLEAIMFVGDGYDDLITGFKEAINIEADVFVIEGGPFNSSKSPTESFAKAIAMSRILCPGKVVATNGAYENECRIGLRAGLNIIITGFPNNHHGYMCGYSPGSARRGKFGLPRVIKIMNEEIKDSITPIPIQREELLALSKAVKIAGSDNIYPNKIGSFTVGDAHWATLVNSKMYKNMPIEKSLKDILSAVNGKSVALLGGRFLSWVIAKELDKSVDEIIISDINPWVEKVTIENLQEELTTTIIPGNSNDIDSSSKSDSVIITSTIKGIVDNISKKVPNTLNFL